jgi:hypothetical protein
MTDAERAKAIQDGAWDSTETLYPNQINDKDFREYKSTHLNAQW